jgi:hypothetical protein
MAHLEDGCNKTTYMRLVTRHATDHIAVILSECGVTARQENPHTKFWR